MRGFFLDFTFDLPTMRVVDPARLCPYAPMPSGQGSYLRSLKHR